jgi:uncharacterized cupredoxin-like copper-binding protein
MPTFRTRCSGLVLLALAGCGKAEKPAEQAAAAPAAPRSVHVIATDYAFTMPDTVPGGLTAFHLMNQGKQPHHMVVLRLAPGQHPADLARMAPGAPMPEGMVLIGGPNFAVPGGTAEATVDLQPGQYAVFCAIPGPEGKPHFALGMLHGLTVVAATSATAAPSADLTITLGDYSFTESAPLTAGKHVIRVDNAGAQPHEMVFVKLEPGKTIEDFARWVDKMQGPPPVSAMPGVGVLSPGQTNYISDELTPGDYGFICFAADAKDGKPHFLHGMLKQFKVG